MRFASERLGPALLAIVVLLVLALSAGAAGAESPDFLPVVATLLAILPVASVLPVPQLAGNPGRGFRPPLAARAPPPSLVP